MDLRNSVVAASESRQPLTRMPQRITEGGFVAEALLNSDADTLLETPVARAAASATSVLPIDVNLSKRAANLAFAGAKPSTAELERLIGNNDLVDEFYLQRALIAAKPVMRITLRDSSGRERGWATGFMVSPNLMLTNWHVFPTQEETANAVAEANYVLDIAGNPARSYRFAIRGDAFYASDEELDFALVSVDPITLDRTAHLSQFGYHRLIGEANKIREGESMTLIQHPGGERRQFAIRENRLQEIQNQFLWYKSDTAPGSSGAPVFNDSFQVVALHHSGAAQRDEQGLYVLRDGRRVASLDGVDESNVNWVANEGLRISVLCDFLRANLQANHPYVQELFQAFLGGDVMTNVLGGNAPMPLEDEDAAGRNQQEDALPALPLAQGRDHILNIPLQLQISLVAAEADSVHEPKPRAPIPDRLQKGKPAPQAAGVEALRYPLVDRDYTSRLGYDVDFLNIPVALPTVTDTSRVAQMEDGKYELPYEHFTIVVDKVRRLPLFTASNVSYEESLRRPEPGDYSRKGLTGLGPNDQEKWFTDPRIPQQHQLPDVFYTKDGGNFDKGHVVRRDDVCWGESYEQVVRANGDTFHVTNCSPQIAGFNRSNEGIDNWGDLENEIQKQGKAERLSVLAGPILAKNDKFFEGRDDFGPVKIQLPRAFWKIVLANENGKLAAYAFILKQNLKNVPAEFQVTATWKPYLVSITALEKLLTGFSFPAKIQKADRFSTHGQELAAAIGAELGLEVGEGGLPVAFVTEAAETKTVEVITLLSGNDGVVISNADLLVGNDGMASDTQITQWPAEFEVSVAKTSKNVSVRLTLRAPATSGFTLEVTTKVNGQSRATSKTGQTNSQGHFSQTYSIPLP